MHGSRRRLDARRSHSLLTLLSILCGIAGATGHAHAQDALSYGDFGEWVFPPEQANDGPDGRLAYGRCELTGSLGRTLHVRLGTHGHLRSPLPDDSWARLDGPVQQFASAVSQANPRVLIELVCGTSATSDLEFFQSSWRPLGISDEPYFECPAERPYLLAARCQTVTGPGTIPEGVVSARTPHTPSQPARAGTPANASIASVTANGTGCPEGTWTTEMTENGLNAIVTFTSYGAAVDAGNPIAGANCQLAIGLANTEQVSYAIESIVFDGDATILPGVTAQLVAMPYPQGFPERGVSSTSDFDGVFNGTFESIIVFGVPPFDMVEWSACGPAHDLNLATRIELQSEAHGAGTSFVNLSSTSAGSTARIAVRLVARGC